MPVLELTDAEALCPQGRPRYCVPTIPEVKEHSS